MSVERAKSLRKQMTDAERRLWYRLRAHRFNGLKFKRQVPVGPFIVDFASMHARVVVEVDGGQHADNRADVARDRYLQDRGFRVLRFWNNNVLRSTDEVLAVIASAVTPEPSPSPGSALRASPPSPPKGGEGKKLTIAEVPNRYVSRNQERPKCPNTSSTASPSPATPIARR